VARPTARWSFESVGSSRSARSSNESAGAINRSASEGAGGNGNGNGLAGRGTDGPAGSGGMLARALASAVRPCLFSDYIITDKG